MEVVGKTVISDDVFVELARTSLHNVNEVYRQERRGALAELTQLLAEKFIPQIVVKRTEADAAEVDLGKVSYEMKLTLNYGINIPEAVKKVRETVATEVESLTGYHVERIDVVVDKLVRSEKLEG